MNGGIATNMGGPAIDKGGPSNRTPRENIFQFSSTKLGNMMHEHLKLSCLLVMALKMSLQSCSRTGVAFLHLLFFQLVNWSILRNTTFYPALQAFLLFSLTILCGVRLKSGFFAEETRSGLVEMTGMDRRNIYSHFRQAQISLPCKLEVLLDTYSSRPFIAGPKTSSS
jgi:hypothetical protein